MKKIFWIIIIITSVLIISIVSYPTNRKITTSVLSSLNLNGMPLLKAETENVLDLNKVINLTYKDESRTGNTTEINGDLTKEYFSDEKRLLITDKELVSIDITMNSNYREVVFSGKDVLIAEFTLNSFREGNIADEIKTFDIKKNYSEINKKYYWKYYIKYKEEICDKEGNCKEAEWIVFNQTSELPFNENIKIGLFTSITNEEEIEWVMKKDGFYIYEWGVVKGVSAGFVTERPTGTLTDTVTTSDTLAIAISDIAPAGATKVTEIGWYTSSATEDADYQVGLYTNGETSPDSLIDFESGGKGTTSGWKYHAVDIDITGGNTYWIATQLDDTATATKMTYGAGLGDGQLILNVLELPDVWESDTSTTRLYAFYAVYETGGGLCTGSSNCEIDCTTNPTVSSNLDIGGYNVTTSGSGTITFNANFTNVDYFQRTSDCLPICKSGCFRRKG